MHKTRTKLADHLGRKLRAARQEAELTQADVAERVGLATEVYGRMERGHVVPSVPTMRKLCRTLRVDANALLALDARRPPQWLEANEPAKEDPLRLRRLLRSLRQMDDDQLAALSSMAHTLLRRPSGKRLGAAARR